MLPVTVAAPDTLQPDPDACRVPRPPAPRAEPQARPTLPERRSRHFEASAAYPEPTPGACRRAREPCADRTLRPAGVQAFHLGSYLHLIKILLSLFKYDISPYNIIVH